MSQLWFVKCYIYVYWQAFVHRHRPAETQIQRTVNSGSSLDSSITIIQNQRTGVLNDTDTPHHH